MKSLNLGLIKREIRPLIISELFKNKVIILYGPRRVGKTTLTQNILNHIQKKHPKKTITFLNGDEPHIRENLTNKSSTELKAFIGQTDILAIDEAQRIKNIGLTLKLIHDNYPEIQIIATGSSSFDLANQIKEPLTGRSFELNLYPLSLQEIKNHLKTSKLNPLPLDQYLINGTYPEIFTFSNPTKTIQNIANNYLYKDVLIFQNIKSSEILDKLLQTLALQIGSEVSYNELANLVGIDKLSIQRYLSILEQAFIIFRLTPFSRNLRKELNKKRKIYFWDLGIRNAIINNFNPLNLRNDTGPLWENFTIAQKIISDRNQKLNFNYYFWRTYDQQEIDFIKEAQGKLEAYEIKWSAKKKIKPPKAWRENYPNSTFKVLTPQSIL